MVISGVCSDWWTVIGGSFVGDALLLVDVQHVLAGSGAAAADPVGATVLQDSAPR